MYWNPHLLFPLRAQGVLLPGLWGVFIRAHENKVKRPYYHCHKPVWDWNPWPAVYMQKSFNLVALSRLFI